MDDDEEERRGIVKRLLDVCLRGRTITKDEEQVAVHRLGTLALRRKKNDNDD
jgi:hypothetical protein